MLRGLSLKPRTKHLLRILPILLAVTIGLSFPATLIYTQYRAAVIVDLQERALGIATLTAEVISQDIESYKKLYEIEDYGTGNLDRAYYEKMNALFRQMKANSGADFLYTEKLINNDRMLYLLDGEEPGSEDFSPIGTEDVASDYEVRACSTATKQVSDLVFFEGWGYYISSVAPILDPGTGNCLGLVGVDFSIEALKEKTQNMKMLIIFCFIQLNALISLLVIVLNYLRYESQRIDYLTRLSTKRHFERELRQHVLVAKKNNKPFSLLMVDTDGFKGINDTYGHPVGDEVLKQIALVLKDETSQLDTSARIGGDEFSVILDHSRLQTALKTANAICKKVEALRMEEYPELRITVSIGVAQWTKPMDVSQMTDHADKALYRAKLAGKNQVSE